MCGAGLCQQGVLVCCLVCGGVCQSVEQPSPMSNASGMLQILDLVSLARLTLVSGKVLFYSMNNFNVNK